MPITFTGRSLFPRSLSLKYSPACNPPTIRGRAPCPRCQISRQPRAHTEPRAAHKDRGLGAGFIGSLARQRGVIHTAGPRAVAQRDKVDHVVLHFQDRRRLALYDGDARRPAGRVVSQSPGKYHVRLPATDSLTEYLLERAWEGLFFFPARGCYSCLLRLLACFFCLDGVRDGRVFRERLFASRSRGFVRFIFIFFSFSFQGCKSLLVGIRV